MLDKSRQSISSFFFVVSRTYKPFRAAVVLAFAAFFVSSFAFLSMLVCFTSAANWPLTVSPIQSQVTEVIAG